MKRFIDSVPPHTHTHAHTLGRWSLKHDPRKWENYLSNLHADPGYPNIYKEKWIEILNDKDKDKGIKALKH